MNVIGINLKWVLDQFGVSADEEIVELGTLLMVRFQEAPDRRAFVKATLRKALGAEPASGTATRKRL
jgi:hypothetical protein